MAYRAYSEKPFELLAAEGLIPGVKIVSVYGSNAITGATYEDVWSAGGDIHWPSISTTASIVSDSAEDKIDGTGLYQIKVSGLDDVGVEQSEVVNLTGLVAVVTSSTWSMICDISSVAMGSSNTNGLSNGIINATVDAGVCCVMPADYGKSAMAGYTVPAGKTAYLAGYQISAPDADDAIVSPVMRISRTSPWMVGQDPMINQAIYAGIPAFPLGKMPAGSDLRWRAKRVGAGDVSISIYFQLILVDD